MIASTGCNAASPPRVSCIRHMAVPSHSIPVAATQVVIEAEVVAVEVVVAEVVAIEAVEAVEAEVEAGVKVLLLTV